MGLAEQLRAGASLVRKSTTFTTDPSGIGAQSIDSSYAILSIQVNAPCRIRFYDNEASRDDVAEAARPFTDTGVPSSVALVGDFSMSAAGIYSTDPILYAVSENFSSPLTYYRIEPSTPQTNVTLTTYTIEDNTIIAGESLIYAVDNRRNLPIVTASLSGGEFETGSISNSTIPQTYLLVHASGSDVANIARLRLYSNSGSLSNADELNRPFSTEPSASAYLITDVILNGTDITYFSPKIIGSNLQNMGPNLLLIRGNQEALSGKNEMYYVLENLDPLAVDTPISASVSVFALEG
jgi:hypothetical protein